MSDSVGEPADRQPENRDGRGGTLPAPAKAAATVVLARVGAHSAIEIYFVQRHGSMGFMGGMHVFPGGKVAPSDASPQMRARIVHGNGPSRHELWGEDIDRNAALDRTVAGVRETFEEAGVLLIDDALRCDRARMRARLHAGEELGALLEEADLWLRLELLEPFSRWITPESEPVRFDTSFYLAHAPDGQEAEHDAKESVAGLWLTAARALEAASAGEIRLAPPTARTVETLQEAGTVAAAFTLARSRPPPLIMPIIRTQGQEVVIFYPGDPEHPVRQQALPGPTRRVMRRLP